MKPRIYDLGEGYYTLPQNVRESVRRIKHALLVGRIDIDKPLGVNESLARCGHKKETAFAKRLRELERTRREKLDN